MSTERIFVGRREELDKFDHVLRAQEGQVVLVVGQQGMGKTMLVNRMARAALGRLRLTLKKSRSRRPSRGVRM